MSFDGIVMNRYVRALNEALITGKVSRIYQVSNYELLIHIRAKGKNVKLLLSAHPSYARFSLTTMDYPTPPMPSQLVMSLRKHLEGAFIKEIRQLGLERIAMMTFLGRNEMGDDTHLTLYLEIMGKHSNIILVRQDGTIIDAIKRINPEMSQVRIVQPGARYEYPPLFDHKKDPRHFEGLAYDKMYLDWSGMSPVLAKELTYRQEKGEDVKEVLTKVFQSDHLYIAQNAPKEEFHLIPLTHLSAHFSKEPLYDGLDHFYAEKDEKDRIKQQTSDLKHFLHNEWQKNTNKIYKLEQTLFESTNSEDLRLKGELLYSYLDQIQKGMTQITVENYYDNTPLTIELDPRFDGKTNAKRYFSRYTKAKNSISILQEQIEKTKNEIEYFDGMLAMMENAGYYDALEMKEELESLGYLHKKKHAKGPKQKKKMPHFESWIAKDGTEIWIGKNNLQNDFLTFKHARKQYYWFHVKDMPGSHVIVCQDTLDEYLIRLAANLAALYSKAAYSSSVPVNYAKVQSLKKAPGGIPGKVILSHYKTIYIDPDPAVRETLTKKGA